MYEEKEKALLRFSDALSMLTDVSVRSATKQINDWEAECQNAYCNNLLESDYDAEPQPLILNNEVSLSLIDFNEMRYEKEGGARLISPMGAKILIRLYQAGLLERKQGSATINVDPVLVEYSNSKTIDDRRGVLAKKEINIKGPRIHRKNGFEYCCEKYNFGGQWLHIWKIRPEGEPIFLQYTNPNSLKTLKKDVEALLANPDLAETFYREKLARVTDIPAAEMRLKQAKEAAAKVTGPDFDWRGNNPNKGGRLAREALDRLQFAKNDLEMAKRYSEILDKKAGEAEEQRKLSLLRKALKEGEDSGVSEAYSLEELMSDLDKEKPE